MEAIKPDTINVISSEATSSDVKHPEIDSDFEDAVAQISLEEYEDATEQNLEPTVPDAEEVESAVQYPPRESFPAYNPDFSLRFLSDRGTERPDLLHDVGSPRWKSERNDERPKPFTEAEMLSLYDNQLLREQPHFTNNFVEMVLKSNEVKEQPLNKMIREYLTHRDSKHQCRLEVERCLKNYELHLEQIWCRDTSSITQYGECQDGNPVSATHKYDVYRFNDYIYEKFVKNLNDIELLTSEETVHIFNENMLDQKIDHYVKSLCGQFSYLSQNTSIRLLSVSSPRGPYGIDYRPLIHELKSAISVLFSYERRLYKDEQFTAVSRIWLRELIAVLLRVSTSSEFLFILHHVIRCPAGVGDWAAYFIQAPVFECGSNFDQMHTDHLLALLSVILLPVADRELFLQTIDSAEENDNWVIVDSDGEGSDGGSLPRTCLKEDDIIALFNQIPVADIFRQILSITRRNGEDIYNIDVVSDRDMLRCFAISTLLVTLLEKGIANFSNPAYTQFCRRLSRLIEHTAAYITDHLQIYRDAYFQRSIVDTVMLHRLQTEYDEFFCRIVNCLYTSNDRIGWQYLASLPFHMITIQTLWRLYQFLLHTNTDKIILMSEEFMEHIGLLPNNDIYYFLTTITNMALDRQKQDWIFIQTVTLQLFQIGFVNSSVRDNCMKSARILISNLTLKHPSLISDIVIALKKDFVSVGKYSLYLFKELPVSLWKPCQADLLALNDWLLTCSIPSWQNNLARYIISQLNWTMDSNNTELFLPREFHCQIAILVIKSLYVYAEETPVTNSAALLLQSIRQMSSMVRSQTPEQAFTLWAWQILSKLKLHLLDQPDRSIRMALTSPCIVAQLPNINSDLEDMQVLSDGIRKNQSVAYYATILMTNIGHDLPLICESCWEYCCTLLTTYKHLQVLHVLQVVLPVFLDSIDSLLKIEKFQIVITQLISSDITYIKMAKTLVSSDFPGLILQQFASLIMYHITNYQKYCLHSKHQMVEMWLRILCSVWGDNCNSVAYLMDKVLTFAFEDKSIRDLITKTLTELIQIMSVNQCSTSSGLASLVSWIGYSISDEMAMVPVSLLPRKPSTISHSPYFAFWALFLEEHHTQLESRLWNEVLKIVSATAGKPNIDAAVKKACLNLKLSPVSSAWLSIYRWSQYALDIPVDHPLLCLFWQRFFLLYFHRVPGSNTGCVGYKFFEGTINGVYFKKLRQKLQDCYNFFARKSAEKEEEKNKIKKMTSLYETFLIWLDEPRLQESDICLPNLPAKYRSTILSEILNGQQDLWLEYVDFNKISFLQTDFSNRWTNSLCRQFNKETCRFSGREKSIPLCRILKRLNSYDDRLPPPDLYVAGSSIPEIPRETLINKDVMLTTVHEHIESIIYFTKNYRNCMNDQKFIIKKISDTIKKLYVEVEVVTKYYASCDTHAQYSDVYNFYQPKYRRNTVQTINCAGPALVAIESKQWKINNAADYIIRKEKIEFNELLSKMNKEPFAHLITSCIVIDNLADTLCREMKNATRIGDVVIRSSLQSVGIALFYKLLDICRRDISLFNPTGSLSRRIMNNIGQSFIDNVDHECPKLLSTILKKPFLCEMLISHFTPSAVAATTFVELYRKVASSVNSEKDNEMILSLLEKFNIRTWLESKNPKLAERSRLIKIVSVTLKEIGSKPMESSLPVHRIMRRNLCEILVHDFPEHYGEILFVMLKYSAEEKFSPDIWFDFLNTLLFCAQGSKPSVAEGNIILQPGMSVTQIRDIAKKYASDSRSLTFYDLKETSNMLGLNFLKERLQYGLYGLYPKYCIYIEPLIALHSMIGHSCVVMLLHMQRGALANKICEQIWPIIADLFSPWIIPYFTGNLQEPPAPWIQQLTDDRSVLLPWVDTDRMIANKMMTTFVECIKFVMDTLPGCNPILNGVFQWYIMHYAHQSVKEYVLDVVHNNLLTLSWTRFLPSLPDLELMMKIVDQYLPACHSFLGSVFIEIPWNIIIQNTDVNMLSRIQAILLNLLIKLGNEPHLRQSGKITALLLEAQQFSWHLIDKSCYSHVLDWFVMSYDPRVILYLTDEEWNGIDTAAFDLLQMAGGYAAGRSDYHMSTHAKRRMFIKACVKMLLQLTNRYKAIFSVQQSHLESALMRMFDKMESVTNFIKTSSGPVECGKLLSEVLTLVNQPVSSTLPKLIVHVLLVWLTHRDATSTVLQGLLLELGSTVSNQAHLGILLEACFTAWFKNSAGMEEYDWNKALAVFSGIPLTHPPIEDSLLANNQILTLYALALKQKTTDSTCFMYSRFTQWIVSLKPNNDNESKLALLWSLALNKCSEELPDILPHLLKLSNYFQQIAHSKHGWGLLGVIGLNKQQVPSTRCKILCYAISAFILSKLNEENNDSAAVIVEATSLDENTERNEEKNVALIDAESVRAVASLEGLLHEKQYAEYRVTIELAERLVLSKETSIDDGDQFVIALAKQLYTDGYVHACHSKFV